MAEYDDEPPFPALSPPEVQELSESAQEALSLLKQQAADAAEDGNQELALQQLSEAVALGCASALLYCRRAQLLLQLGRPRGAANDCTAALAINPDSGKAFKTRARARAMLEDWERALADFQQGLQIDYDEGTYEESLVAAARVQAGRKKQAQLWDVVGGADKGGVLVREGQELSSEQRDGRLATGAVVEELELVGERLHFRTLSGAGPAEGWVSTTFKERTLLQRTDEPPFPAMGPTRELSDEDRERQIELKQQAAEAADEAEALQRLTEAIALGEASALMYSRRAQALLKLGRPRAAVRDCTAALEVNPDSGKAFKIRARGHAALSHWAEAHADFQQGLKIDYDEGTYEESLQAAEKAKELQKRLKEEEERALQAAEAKQAAAQAKQGAAQKAAAAAKAPAAAPAPQPTKASPKLPPGAKGDGITKCIVCGFKATNERDKQVHSGLQGHAGFYDANGRLAKYTIMSKGGG